MIPPDLPPSDSDEYTLAVVPDDEAASAAWLGIAQELLSVLARFLGFGLMAGGIVYFTLSMLNNAFTPDLPWLLDGGKFIREHHMLPTHDLFSWTNPTRAWVLYQWLFEVIISWLRDTLGLAGLIRAYVIFNVALYVMIPYRWHRARGIPFFFSLPVCALALAAAGVNLSLRPMIVTVVLLLVQFMVVWAYRRDRISQKVLLPVIAVIYMLWANMHTGVTIGLLSLLLMGFGDWLESSYRYAFLPVVPEIEAAPVASRIYAKVILIAFLFSLVNPYGVGIYSYLAALSSQSYLNNIISELQSPDFHLVYYWCFTVLFTTFILLMTRMRRVFSAQAMLHCFVFFLATLFVQRFIVWTSLFYALYLPGALHHSWMLSATNPDGALRRMVLRFETYQPLFNVLLVLATATLLFFPHAKLRPTYGHCAQFFPGIRQYVKTLRQATDRAYMLPEVGSCMLFIDPQAKVYGDTRYDFYGAKFVEKTYALANADGKWRSKLEKKGINTILIPPNWLLASRAELKAGFKPIYSDGSLVILRKESGS